MFKFLFKRKAPVTPVTPVTAVNRVSVDDLIEGILDDGSTNNLVVLCITEQDYFGIGCTSYATMRSNAIITETILTLEDSNGNLYHLTGAQFLQWTQPMNGVWA